MKDTITESELTAITKAARKTRPALTFEKFLRVALGKLGITVIPDPIPEPEGDVIVVDQYAVCWRKGRDYWIDFASGERRPWSDLDGLVKIYRLEGETK